MAEGPERGLAGLTADAAKDLAALMLHFDNNWERLQELEGDGLIEMGEDYIQVTERGRFLVRIICMAFDSYLATATEKFSKAI